jgi:hypothetical protein
MKPSAPRLAVITLLSTKMPLSGGTETEGKRIPERILFCCYWRPLLCLALCALSPGIALAQSVSTVESPWVLINKTTSSAPCPSPSPARVVYFDGAISPFSYTGTSGQTVVQLNASLGDQNFRYVGSLTSENGLVANYQVDCNLGQSMYTSLKSPYSDTFRWSEWLYGFYRSTATGYVYATIYNEYYGGNYTHGGIADNGCLPSPLGYICNYSGIGLARSIDNGRTFSPIQQAPGHVIARVPYLYYENAGHGMGSAFEGGGMFCNPNDGYLYRMLNQFHDTASGDFGVTIIRTAKANIDDPTSWKAWDGSGYNRSFFPSGGPPGTYGEVLSLPFLPYYLGWSAYFHKYIMTGLCNDTGCNNATGTYCFALSSDLIHWTAAIDIRPVDPQACPQSGSGLPSLLDPSYLAQTSNECAASGGTVGQTPYLVFIRGTGTNGGQQVTVQRLSFAGADTTPPEVAITSPANGASISQSSVQITATASDNVGVVGVLFQRDGQDLGPEVTTPTQGVYSITWNTAGQAGTHTLTAIARDDYGNTRTASVVVTVTVSGNIFASPNPCTIGANTSHCSSFLSWTTSPSLAATAQVRVSWDGGPEVLFACEANSSVPDEAYWIGAGTSVAFKLYPAPNCDGNAPLGPLLASVIVTGHDIAPPTVAITSPANGASISQSSVQITATASDNVGVVGVQFQVDGQNLGPEVTTPTQGVYSTTWNTAHQAGTHTLKAIARDGDGNFGTHSVDVTVTVSGTISASPNPCTIGANTNHCSSFLSWTTSPSLAATAQVRVSWDGGPEVLFACEANSSVPDEAYWIGAGTSVAFKLYPAPNCDGNAPLGPLLASVIVTGNDIAPPTGVAVTEPFNNAHVRGAAVALSGTASDNTGVVAVQFRRDCPGASCFKIGAEILNPPGSFSATWNTLSPSIPDGTHTLTVLARDVANSTISAPITVTVDNTAPTGVAVTAPANGAIVRGTAVPITAVASDNIVLESVQFQVDGNNLGGRDKSFPYSTDWNTTTETNGTHTLTAVARDSAGNTTTSAPITVTVDNVAPTGVSVTNPLNGAYVRGTAVTVSGTASDNVGVVGVQFKRDCPSLNMCVNIGSEILAAPYSTTWNTLFPSTSDGTHTLTAVARDQAGNVTTSAPIRVTVDNTAPTAEITNPESGEKLSGEIRIIANASDNFAVASMQFSLGGSEIGELLIGSSPFYLNFDTTSIRDGVYTLTATAYDMAGNSGESREVEITVNNSFR